MPKDRLLRLVEELPENEVPAAERYLEYLRDKGDSFFAWLQSLPEEEEELSYEAIAALEEAREAIKRGEVVSDEEVARSRR